MQYAERLAYFVRIADLELRKNARHSPVDDSEVCRVAVELDKLHRAGHLTDVADARFPRRLAPSLQGHGSRAMTNLNAVARLASPFPRGDLGRHPHRPPTAANRPNVKKLSPWSAGEMADFFVSGEGRILLCKSVSFPLWATRLN
jgi:hypothetical protein